MHTLSGRRNRVRVLGGRVRSLSRPEAPPGDPHAITSVTDDGSGNGVIHTGAAHGLSVGDWVYIVWDSWYSNGMFQVASVPTATTFTATNPNGTTNWYERTDTGTWSLGFAFTCTQANGNGDLLIECSSAHGLAVHDIVLLHFTSSNYTSGTYEVAADGLTTTAFACTGLGFDDIADSGGGAKIP